MYNNKVNERRKKKLRRLECGTIFDISSSNPKKKQFFFRRIKILK